MEDPDLGMSHEEVHEHEQITPKSVSNVEGISNFFNGLGRRKTKKKAVEEPEAHEEHCDGDPFVRGGKLYGQNYQEIKVNILYYYTICL